MKLSSGIIYHLFNTETGKCYVGQTWRDLKFRFRAHCVGNDSLISRSIKKRGISAFICTVLSMGICSQEELDNAECYWIEFFNCISPYGYNLVGGRSSPGLASEETRAKIAAVWKGKKRGPMPAAQKEKVRLSKIGSVPSNKGIELENEETRLKLRVSHTGKTVPEEIRYKMRMAKLGKKKSPETIAKMRIAAVKRMADRKNKK